MTSSSMHMGVVDVCAITSRDPDDCGWNTRKACTLPRSNSQRSNYSYSPVATRTSSTLNQHHYHHRPMVQQHDGGGALSDFHRPSLPSVGHMRTVLATGNNPSPQHVTDSNCNPVNGTVIDHRNGGPVFCDDMEIVSRPLPGGAFDLLSPSHHPHFTNCCSPGGIHNFYPTTGSPTNGGSPWKHALTPIHHVGGMPQPGRELDPRDLHPQCTCSMRRTTPQFNRRRDEGRQDVSTRLHEDTPPLPPPP